MGNGKKLIKNVTCLQIDDFKFGHVHGQNKKIMVSSKNPN
jgi:hypothetical protein